jgi:hypothetical protein
MMRLDAIGLPRFSPWVERGIGVASVLLLFMVKINLLSVGGQSAGLRLDDMVVFALALLLAIGALFSFRTVIGRVELYAALIFTLYLTSNAVNLIMFHASNPLYSFRFVEYFVFFYFGAYYCMSYRLRPLLAWILWVNGIVIILQALGWLGGFVPGGFTSSTGGRPIGLTGGPWEIGTVINICFAYLINDTEKKSSRSFVILLFFATLGLVLLTGARMPLIAHLAILFIYFLRQSKRPLLAAMVISAPIAVLVTGIILIPNPVMERSENLFTTDNVQLLETAYRNIQPTHEQIKFDDEDADSSDEDTDASWVIRTMKWAYVIKLWQLTPVAWLIGLGPGACGPALDGGWTRITVETGVIGVLLFVTLLRKIASCSHAMQGVVVALCINMIMLDTHLAYKAMSLLFFCVGYGFQEASREKLAALPAYSPHY